MAFTQSRPISAQPIIVQNSCRPAHFIPSFPFSYQNPRFTPPHGLHCTRHHLFQRLVTHAVADSPQSPSPTNNTAAWVEVGIVGPPHGVRGEFKVQPLTDFPEDRLGEPGPRWLAPPPPKMGRSSPPPPPLPTQLQWGRASIYKGREVWIVKLDHINAPEEVQFIRGHTILIPAAQRARLDDDDEFYAQELIGLQVILDATGEIVGKVVDIFDGTGTHDVMRIDVAPSFVESRTTTTTTTTTTDDDEVKECGDDNDNDNESEDSKKDTVERKKRSGVQAMLPFAKQLVPIVNVEAGWMRVVPPEGLFEMALEQPVAKKQRRREHAGKRERRNSSGRDSDSDNSAVDTTTTTYEE